MYLTEFVFLVTTPLKLVYSKSVKKSSSTLTNLPLKQPKLNQLPEKLLLNSNLKLSKFSRMRETEENMEYNPYLN